jgi:hypothetical protein
MATISRKESRDTDQNQTKVMFKLDSCGSVFIAHADHLIRVKSAKPYGLQNIRLLGIGEKNQLLDGGDAEKVILLGLHTMMKASINILQHMKNSLEGNCMQ